MGSKLRKEDIIAKINELGIDLADGIKWTNDKMIKKLGDHFLGDDKSFSRNFVQSMETVQLCHHMKDELSFFKVSPLEMESPSLVIENIPEFCGKEITFDSHFYGYNLFKSVQ